MTRKVKRIKAVKLRNRKGFQASRGSTAEDERLESNDLTSLHGVVLRRVEGAVRHLVQISPPQQLYDALSTNTPMDTLIHLVTREGAAAEVALKVEDPLRPAKARAAKRMSELLSAEGGPMGVEEVARRLRITRAAVDKRRKTGTLIGIGDGGRAVLYPGWQFTEKGLVPGIDDTLRAIGVSDPWMRMEFFLTHDPDLRARPLDALRQGRKAEVTLSAKRFGRYGEDG